MDFKDKVVWITGASSGIGAALAWECAKHGAKVVLSARNAEALTKVAADCPDSFVLPMDVTHFDAMPGLTKQVLDRYGRIDVLILNAGVSQRSRAIDTTLAVDEAILRTNFLGPVALTKAVLPSMVAAKSGRIVVISSLVGKFGTPLRSSYAASRARAPRLLRLAPRRSMERRRPRHARAARIHPHRSNEERLQGRRLTPRRHGREHRQGHGPRRLRPPRARHNRSRGGLHRRSRADRHLREALHARYVLPDDSGR